MEQKRKQEFDECMFGPKRSKVQTDTGQTLSVPLVERGRETVMFSSSSGQKTSTVTEGRNLFSELEKIRTGDKSEMCFMPQAVPSITHDSPAYMDSAIQPSPKDSGVDMSSPERKLDDLGDLSSQESSPRITDPTLHLDTDKDIRKSTLKYAAIGNFPEVSDGMYLGSIKCGPVDPNMNHSDGACMLGTCGKVGFDRRVLLNAGKGLKIDSFRQRQDAVQPILKQREEDRKEESAAKDKQMMIDPVTGLLAVPQENKPHSNSSHPRTDLFVGKLEVTVGSSRDCMDDDSSLVEDSPDAADDVLCRDDCTLAQLNMSQKSTEVDLRALVGKDFAESEKEQSEFRAFAAEDSLGGNDLFASLNEDSMCSFSSSGSPSKKLFFSPKTFKSSQQGSPRSSSGFGGPKPTSPKPAQPTGFMSEFTKFLQSNTSIETEPKKKKVPTATLR